MDKHPWRCRCGAMQGELAEPQVAARAACYCADCQAFARFLGEPHKVLDAAGGSDILATVPRHLSIGQGLEHLACMSLSPKGLLRWYADCCRTPIGNTPRDPRLSYVGLLLVCLASSDAEVDRDFGPCRTAINTAAATAPVKSTPFAGMRGLLGILRNVLGARLSGRYRENPFFKPGTAEPVRTPRVLSIEERRALTPAR